MKQILSGNVIGQFKNFKTYSAKLVQPMERKIKTVLVDLSGTIHIENEVVPGSLEALKRQAAFMVMGLFLLKSFGGSSLGLLGNKFTWLILHIR